MNRKDLQLLARVRLAESKALLKARRPDGAYYLAGYSVECALKACIARETRRYDFPDKRRVDASYTHSLRGLITAAKLENELLKDMNSNPAFRKNWDLVQDWSEQRRYSRSRADEAEELIKAIDSRENGVLVWIKRRW